MLGDEVSKYACRQTKDKDNNETKMGGELLTVVARREEALTRYKSSSCIKLLILFYTE